MGASPEIGRTQASETRSNSFKNILEIRAFFCAMTLRTPSLGPLEPCRSYHKAPTKSAADVTDFSSMALPTGTLLNREQLADGKSQAHFLSRPHPI